MLTRTVLITSVVLVAAVAGCSSSDATTSESSSSATTEEVANMADVQRLWIGPEMVDCEGAGPQTCMVIRRSVDGPEEYFYDSIQGFTHQVGTSYVVEVEVTTVENPPADGSSLSYRLVDIVESTEGAGLDETGSGTPADETIDLEGSAWQLVGFLRDPSTDSSAVEQPVDGTNPTFDVANGRINGSSGCNSYSTTFEQSDGHLVAGPIASTRMACQPAINAQEMAFLAVLDAQPAIVTDGEQLHLVAPDLTLVFERRREG